MNQKELKDIIKVMKKMGVLYLKTADIELSLSQDALIKKTAKMKAVAQEPLRDQTNGHMGYTDEEVLLWSAQAVDEAG